MNDGLPPLAEPMPPHDPETGELLPADMGGALVPSGAQQTAFGSGAIKMLMSTPIVEKRNPTVVRQRLRALCAENGDKYVYSWEVQDRKNRRKTLIEGLTIKAAMDLWRAYGNCFAGPLDVDDRGTHWLFTAVFFDRETGSIALRSFLQRKGQETGMRDRDRAEDIIFQIGQSKAIRNVIINALAGDANYMLELSKRRLVDWVEQNREKVDGFIDKVCEEQAIDLLRIEAAVGRTRKQWTSRDLARVVAELRGIDEGLQNEQDAFPALEAAGEIMAEKDAKAETDKKADTKADTKKETKTAKKTATKRKTAAAKEAKADPPTKETSNGGGEETSSAGDGSKKKATAKPAEGGQESELDLEGPEAGQEAEGASAPPQEPASNDQEADDGSDEGGNDEEDAFADFE